VSTDPAAPAELSFGAAYDRLQAVAAELGADRAMAPDRLIALLREGKGLERALRDHLERVEQEVRAIEDGDGAVAFRIVDAAGAEPARPAPPVAAAAGPVSAAPAEAAAAAPARVAPGSAAAPPPAPEDPVPPAPRPPAPAAPPTLGFPGADDDIPF
jgi:hypothetical protein